MTHRSRSGGPKRSKPSSKPKSKKKLHHPPSAQPRILPTVQDAIARRERDPLLDGLSEGDVLSLVHHALRDTVDEIDFPENVQRVKALLYDRKWLEVFADEALIQVYAGKWVPSRALCYRDLFARLETVREVFGNENTPLGQDEGDEDQEDDEDINEASGDSEDDRSPSIARAGLSEKLQGLEIGKEGSNSLKNRHVLSLGGGASSELLAMAAIVKSFQAAPHPASKAAPSQSEDGDEDEDEDEDEDAGCGEDADREDPDRRPKRNDTLGGNKPEPHHETFKWTGLDIGPWTTIVDKFRSSLDSQWFIGPSTLQIDFTQLDLLSKPTDTAPSSPSDSESAPGPGSGPEREGLPALLQQDPPRLITLLFTLTELLSQSRASTLSLLRQITKHTPKGTLFLVCDSASDISNFPLGAEGREWPVYMVLDALMGIKPASASASKHPSNSERDRDTVARRGEAGNMKGQAQRDLGRGEDWELVEKSNSKWYRLPEGLGSGWPVKLENTRYWLRLYRRL